MTISETAVPAAGGNPYPDLAVPPEGWVTDLPAKYEAMAAAERAANDEWEIGARSRVFPQPGRHAKPQAMAVVAEPGRALTVPDAPLMPLPVPVPAAEPLRVQRPSIFARHGFGKNGPRQGPKRDQPPERTEGIVRPPIATGGTLAPSVAPGQDAPTLKPDDLSTEEVRRAVEAADEIQRQSASALERAGAKPADLAHLARPGDGRDAAEQVTAAIQRPADLGDQK